MKDVVVLNFTAQALILVLWLSMPAILVASLVGTLVSLFQALTQIQEQTLGFAIKLIAVVATLFMTARWIGIELYQYTLSAFQLLEHWPR